MSVLTPLGATRDNSKVREHADDIHNINFTADQRLQKTSILRSRIAAILTENDRLHTVIRSSCKAKQTFGKLRKKYQPSTPEKSERVLTPKKTYWIFFALSGMDFDKSV